MLAENALHADPDFSPDALPHGPVDGRVPAQALGEFSGDVAQHLVPQHLDGAVVDLQRVIERHFVSRQTDVIAPDPSLPIVPS